MSEPLLPYEIEVPNKLINHVRIYIGDLPEFNRLVEGTELSDEKIKLSIQLWIQSFNNTPPILSSKYTALNFKNYLILLHGVIIELLKMAGIVQTRNGLSFVDSGAQFQVNDKGQEYMGWIQNLMQTHVQDVKDLKLGLNAEEAYDHVDSPEAWWPFGET